MNETIKSDLKINGSGKASGGFYNNVVINGSGDINGNIDCTNFKINGSGSVNGNVKSESTVIISGSSNLKANVEADEFKINGSTKVGGDISVGSTKVNGTLDINGSVNGDELTIRGSIKIGNDCNVEVFDSKGGFSVSGLLNAGEINAEIYAPCKAREIGGEKVNVSLGHSFGMKKLLRTIFNIFNMKEELEADIIEADEIYLENTRAKIVRGNNIVIGEGCEIDLVEYKDNYTNNGDSIVKENRRMN
jgi:cytoskeletal protein CcmA (bactofilin family)